MSPKVSVIIPVYNHAQELSQCLASLEQQTFRDFEVIVVDDGSAEPVSSFVHDRDKMTNVIWIRSETNRGAPAARNEGFRRSSGRYVIFLDADAELMEGALEKMARTLDDHPEAAMAYPSFYWGGKLFRGRPFDVEALKRRNYIHTSALVRREAVVSFDESLRKLQDWDFFLTIAERGGRGVWIDEPLYRLEPRVSGMSRWLPAFVHAMPWPILGWMPDEIRRYREAEAIIKRKHGLV